MPFLNNITLDIRYHQQAFNSVKFADHDSGNSKGRWLERGVDDGRLFLHSTNECIYIECEDLDNLVKALTYAKNTWGKG